MTPLKRCADCGVEKPLSEFNKYRRRKDGLQLECRVCHSVRGAKYRADYPAKCRAASARYYVANREILIAKVQAWAKTSAASRKAYYAKRYREKRAAICAAAARRYLKNPEKVRAAASRWHKANPDKAKLYLAARRALKRGAQIGDRKALLALAKWCRTAPGIPCYWCGKATKPKERHLDHIIPLIKGGAHAVGNLCVSCPTCNCRKHDKLPEEFSGQAELRFA